MNLDLHGFIINGSPSSGGGGEGGTAVRLFMKNEAKTLREELGEL